MNIEPQQTIIKRHGGKGSGWFAPPLGDHAGEKEKKIPEISGSYPESTSNRRMSNNYAGGGPYTEVDAAVKVPVKFFNEELKLDTFASCEGHDKEWADGGLGYKYRKDGRLQGCNFQESYIAIYTNEKTNNNLYEFLSNKGFKEGSTVRHIGREEFKELYKNIDEGHLQIDFRTKGINDIALRVGTGKIDMTKSKSFTIGDKVLKNSNSSFDGTHPLQQKQWDKFRDKGWNKWMTTMNEFKGQEK